MRGAPRMRAMATRARRDVLVAAAVYGLLVVIMWGAFNVHSGLPYETTFVHASETRSPLKAFLYDDPLRLHSRTFYQLAYLLGEALGIGGSYVPFQVVYAALLWARGFLAFLVLRQLLPQHVGVAYAAGALGLTHASDGALLWVGQMNQLGFIFWMLLAVYFLTRAVRTADRARARMLAAAAYASEYLSLWSYESQMFVLLAFPLLLLLTRDRGSRRSVAMIVAWYVVPAIYIAGSVWKYTR